MGTTYTPLRFLACDIRFMDNVAYFRSCGWSEWMSIILAQDEEARLLDRIEREEEANERFEPLD